MNIGRRRRALGARSTWAAPIMPWGEAGRAPKTVARVARRFRGAHRLLHLAQDLRLAEHHGIEAARDAEGVLHGVVSLLAIEVRREVEPQGPRPGGEPALHGHGVVG